MAIDHVHVAIGKCSQPLHWSGLGTRKPERAFHGKDPAMKSAMEAMVSQPPDLLPHTDPDQEHSLVTL